MAIDHPAAARLKERFPNVTFKGASFKGDRYSRQQSMRFANAATPMRFRARLACRQ